jgi:ribosomal protein L40E
MEMLVIAVIAVAAFAAVLVPLFRRRGDGADPAEFDDAPAGPATRAAPVPPAGDTDAAANTPATAAADPTADVPLSGDDIELEVQRYRTALRAGTICRKCGQANPADSAFCFECGERLPRDEAKEFE